MASSTISLWSPLIRALLVAAILTKCSFAYDVCHVAPTSGPPIVFKNCSVFNDEKYGSPVCGDDRRTYPNKLFLDCVNMNRKTNVTVAFNGSCEDPCWISTNEFTQCLPVCGSNGMTFPSRSALECYSNHLYYFLNITIGPAIRMAYVGKCCDPLSPNITNEEIANITPPNVVCGNDGKNYTNNWALFAEAEVVMGLTLLHPGPCRVTCPYSPLYQPYCGSDMKTYGNMQALACKRQNDRLSDLRPLHMGECKPDLANPPNPCSYPCKKPAEYVCASNGITYSSAQQVDCLRFNGANIRILHHGGCTISEVKKAFSKKCGPCDIINCYPEWNPICGINNVTYSSPSAMLCCNPRMTIMYEGICGRPTYGSCYSGVSKPSNEVCGTDGRTYRNEDALYCAQKEDPYLKLKSYGHCGAQDDPCLDRGNPYIDDQGTPVCASDGITYITPYALWCARKSCPDLKFVHSGPCLTEKPVLPPRRQPFYTPKWKTGKSEKKRRHSNLANKSAQHVALQLFLDCQPHHNHLSFTADQTDH